MGKIKTAIKWLTPPLFLLAAKKLTQPLRRSTTAPDKPVEMPDEPAYGYRGNYASWEEAVAGAEGYHASNILDIQRNAMRKVRDGQAVYERDSVLFDEFQYFFALLSALLLIASRNGNRLSVLDFGGALGSSYYQNRQMLSHLVQLDWHVVEQPHFVSAGQAEFQNAQLRFFPTVDQAWASSPPDVVLLSSVLQYLDRPMDLLKEIADHAPPYILIDRTLVLENGPDRIVVQKVPPSIYPASYACRFFAPGTIEAALADRYDLCFRFDASVGGSVDMGDARAHNVGFLFRRRAPI